MREGARLFSMSWCNIQVITMKITFLGTGTSHGVPPIDCMIANRAQCKKNVCLLSNDDPKHRRTRSSIFIEIMGKRLLVDVADKAYRKVHLILRRPLGAQDAETNIGEAVVYFIREIEGDKESIHDC